MIADRERPEGAIRQPVLFVAIGEFWKLEDDPRPYRLRLRAFMSNRIRFSPLYRDFYVLARTVIDGIGDGALGWWAIDGVLRGVNPWRRLLGGAGVVFAVSGAVSLLR